MLDNQSTLCDSAASKGAALYLPIILSTVILQKIALPQTESLLSIGTLFPPVIVGLGLVTRRLVFDASVLFPLAIFFAVVGVGVVFGSSVKATSPSSLALLFVAQVPLATRPISGAYSLESALRFFSTFMLLLSLLGVAQYFSQWFLPDWASFPLDYLLPEKVRLAGYNNLNPLEYGADRVKSNGVFFAEPSFFSQTVALAAIIELQFEQRIARLLIFVAGLVASYSGTGLLIFMLAGVCKVIEQKRYTLFIVGAVTILILLYFGQFLQIDTMTRRVNEFGTADTSGNARFVSIFHLLSRFQIDDASLLFFGVGGGQINSFVKLLPFDGFGPTWGKVFFEFGACGFVSYLVFLGALFRGRGSAVTASLLIIYLFGGGYLSDEAILAPLLLFVSWAPRRTDKSTLKDAQQSKTRWLRAQQTHERIAGLGQ